MPPRKLSSSSSFSLGRENSRPGPQAKDAARRGTLQEATPARPLRAIAKRSAKPARILQHSTPAKEGRRRRIQLGGQLTTYPPASSASARSTITMDQ
eukprot:scaffold553_cov238-Pinguiococcus_pyrenoidosus.AAC.10